MTSTAQHPSHSDGRHSGHDHSEPNPAAIGAATEAQLRRVITDAIDCLEHQLPDGALGVLRSARTGTAR